MNLNMKDILLFGRSHRSIRTAVFFHLSNKKYYLGFKKSCNSFQPHSLQYAVDELKLGELDEASIRTIWSYLNIDQQQLLLYFLNSN